MITYALFLRGVMPTGKNKVPMADLRAALTDAGLLDVRTYIQSGNAVAKSVLDASAIETLVHNTIANRIGPDIAVIARTHAQIQDVLERNPFPPDAASRTYFTLLGTTPETSLLATFEQTDFSPEDIRVDGDTIYTLYATKYSDSKFNNNFFERKLGVTATTRNFNTMTRMLDMSA